LDLRKLLRKPHFVSINKKTDELFKELQKNSIHMAIVVDEYGGTAGIVTMEDLVEAIVGNIRDEYDDDEEAEVQMVSENNFIFQGDTNLDRVQDLLKITFNDEGYDTIGGFVVGLLGRIPQAEELPTTNMHGWTFEVIEVDERRITKIKVYKTRSSDNCAD
ncbi:MAG: transporter associated domain-containing protein, partial [Deltaproteobacteria bacterium]